VDFLSQTGTPLILSRLESFNARVDNSTYENAPNIDIVEEVLTIPSLKNFYCWGLQQLWSEDLRLPLDHLKNVYLDDCRVSDNALVTIVDACKQLESLDVVYSEWSRWTEVRLGMSFLVALAQRKETLKRLTLLLPPGFHQRSHQVVYITAPFDLRRLTNLETLSIDYEILFSERESRSAEDDRHNPRIPCNLPKSISQLNIEGCRLDEDMGESATELISAKRKYNKLEYLRCGYDTLKPANEAERKQVASLSITVAIYKLCGKDLRVVSDDDRVLVPHPFVDSKNHPLFTEVFSDVSDSELGDWEDVDSDFDIDGGEDVDDIDDGEDDEDDDDDGDNPGVGENAGLHENLDVNESVREDAMDDDDKMNEDMNGEQEGRYNLRPR
jgi:hypothetical protein